MKKLIALALVCLLVAALAACGEKTDDTPAATEAAATEAAITETEPAEAGGPALAGAYADAESPVITDEFRQVFAKATETLAGVDYEPYAYLASQIVAGKNHRVLCKATPTVPNAVTTYAIVTVYEDLNGNAEITDILTSTAAAPLPYDEDNPMSGAYGEPTTPEVTDAAKDALTKACEELDGADYEAEALLGVQVIAGYNYEILCKATPVVPNAESYYVVVTVYADLEGGAEITGIVEFGSGVDDSGEEVNSASSQAE